MAKLFVIAHNIRSAYNVGAIFRTADGMGAEKVFLTGYSPVPYDGRSLIQTAAQKMISKTALGAEKFLEWKHYKKISAIISKLKEQDVEIVALEQDSKSIEYSKYCPTKSVALIVGNEPNGIDRRVLDMCDVIIEIPMRGSKNSLNVSVAFGIAGYQISDTIKKEQG